MAEAVDDESNHAFRAAGFAILGGHAQARHRPEKLVGIDICADHASDGGSSEKRAEGRPKAPVEVTRQVVERRISRMQCLGEPPFGSDEGGVSLHPARQGVEGSMLGGQDRCGVSAGVDLVSENGCDQVSALGKPDR